MSTDKSGDGICGESFGVNTSDRVNVGYVNLNRSEVVGSQNSVSPRALSLKIDSKVAKIVISLDQHDELRAEGHFLKVDEAQIDICCIYYYCLISN